MAKILVEPIEAYALSQTKRAKTLFSKVGIIGCGKEGQNIARITSWHGMEVIFIELNEERIESAIDKISNVITSYSIHYTKLYEYSQLKANSLN